MTGDDHIDPQQFRKQIDDWDRRRRDGLGAWLRQVAMAAGSVMVGAGYTREDFKAALDDRTAALLMGSKARDENARDALALILQWHRTREALALGDALEAASAGANIGLRLTALKDRAVQQHRAYARHLQNAHAKGAAMTNAPRSLERIRVAGKCREMYAAYKARHPEMLDESIFDNIAGDLARDPDDPVQRTTRAIRGYIFPRKRK